ncbi:MAG: LacI family DNA-binding transcriptional regulator [Lachnospiraceae bacterium]|nr:LacI family DNA-binding transcriptional regulator [Lachnospiraceae bacterium]
MAKKVTIRMVAERAGVSRGTVDRVLNHRPHVKPELYDRVIEAMKELGYVPLREHQNLEHLTPFDPDAEEAVSTDPEEEVQIPVRLRLGVVLHNESGYFRTEILRGIESARERLRSDGVEVLLEQCETPMPDEAVERLEHLVQQGVQGIALCLMDHPLIVDKVERLAVQNIPVITFNSDLTGSRRIAFVGQDSYKSGRVAGELMSKCCRPGEKILICVGNTGFSGHRARMKGFLDRIAEKGLVREDTSVVETFNDYTRTYQNVRTALEKIPDLQGIYMANHSVSGCVQALRDLEIQKKIFVISHDLTTATLRLLESEEIDFSISQNIYMQGFQPLLMLQEYLDSGELSEYETDKTAMEVLCCEHVKGEA